jgi:putative transposase
MPVPWSGFDLINAFNAWKTSEAAGRLLVAAPDGTLTIQVGLVWRRAVCVQVMEEAAVDLGRGLAAWAGARHDGSRRGRRVGFPRFKRKGRSPDSFRLRNKIQRGRAAIRVGEAGPRSVTLPVLGVLRVREDTRALRRLLRASTRPNANDPTRRAEPDGPAKSDRTKTAGGPGARILFATVTRRAHRWVIALTIQAPDLHPARRHPPRAADDMGGWIGLDRGLHHLVVAADTTRSLHGVWAPPRTYARNLDKLQRAARTLSRRQPGSARHARAARSLARVHLHVASQRRWWLHQVSTQLVQTHDRLVLETLATANLLGNHRLARAISDAGWAQLARQLTYKQAWHGGQVRLAPRWLASSKTCSACGHTKPSLTLAERTYVCDRCGLVCDRDLNAAANLAAWATSTPATPLASDVSLPAPMVQVPDPQAAGRVTNARQGPRSVHPPTGQTAGSDAAGRDHNPIQVVASTTREGAVRTQQTGCSIRPADHDDRALTATATSWGQTLRRLAIILGGLAALALLLAPATGQAAGPARQSAQQATTTTAPAGTATSTTARQLSDLERRGRELYLTQCAACHGTDLNGVAENGPSLHNRGGGATVGFVFPTRPPAAAPPRWTSCSAPDACRCRRPPPR